MGEGNILMTGPPAKFLLLSFIPGFCKLQPNVHLATPPLPPPNLFLLIKFSWTTATLICLGVNSGCFLVIKAESYAAETIWPEKSKIFTVCSFREKVCQYLLSTLLNHRELELRGTLEMILSEFHSMDEDAEAQTALSD